VTFFTVKIFNFNSIFKLAFSSFLNPPEKISLPVHFVLNSYDIHGYTPLHIASFHGDYLLLKYLIMLGGNPNLKDNKSRKEVLYFAMNDEVRNSVGGLVEAAKKGDIIRLKELVNCGGEINEKKTVFGVAPIHNVGKIDFFGIIFIGY
jgi:Ankyrin repeat